MLSRKIWGPEFESDPRSHPDPTTSNSHKKMSLKNKVDSNINVPVIETYKAKTIQVNIWLN